MFVGNWGGYNALHFTQIPRYIHSYLRSCSKSSPVKRVLQKDIEESPKHEGQIMGEAGDRPISLSDKHMKQDSDSSH